mgnify:CR=1 FL=1
MEKQDDGSPAFPGTTSQPNERGVFYPVQHQGMSLRDAAALAALSGLCSNREWKASASWKVPCVRTALVEEALLTADAFIAAPAR